MKWHLSGIFVTRPVIRARLRPNMNEAANELVAKASIAANGDETAIANIAAALDAACLVFLEVLKDNERGEDGSLKVDIKTRLEAFRTVQDWYVRRAKLNGGRPPGPPVDAGIQAYREMMERDAGRIASKAIEQQMNRRGHKTRGSMSLTKKQKAAAAAKAKSNGAADSSALQAALEQQGVSQ